jgi:hypothetical protein
MPEAVDATVEAEAETVAAIAGVEAVAVGAEAATRQ